MKTRILKTFSIILLLIVASVSIMTPAQSQKAQAASQGYAGKIWKASAVMRKSKSTSSKALVRIPKGKKVTVYGTSGSWRKVTYKDQTGYVLKQYVKISTNAPSLKGNSTSEKGKIVASFAQRFKGNKYVYGRTDLNNGADCSGFVSSVYKSFGVTLPHSSSSLRSVGKKVSAKNIQAGDVVCYSGHVALYIGGGKIVHASNRQTGIKISDSYRYRRVVSIRRIVK